jgi:hypothetical protein
MKSSTNSRALPLEHLLAAALAALSLIALGCDGAAGTTGDEQNADEESAEASEAVIAFDAEWNEVVDGALVEGGTAVLEYDDERVAQCRATQGGIPQYAVTAHYRLGDGDEGSLVVAGLNATDAPTIELEEPGTLEVWFEVTSRHGCHEWDSNFGDNYVFEVAAAE